MSTSEYYKKLISELKAIAIERQDLVIYREVKTLSKITNERIQEEIIPDIMLMLANLDDQIEEDPPLFI